MEPGTRRSYSRDSITEAYNKQNPVKFMRSNLGELQDDGSWIMKKSLILRRKSPIVKNGKFIVKIKRVEGNFNCCGQNLTTLEGGPEYVGGNFWCGDNKLTNLDHGPTYVGGNYSIANNKIKKLNSIQKELDGELDIGENLIKTLEDGPTKINGDFIVGENLLTDLSGCPEGAKNIYIFHSEKTNIKTLNGIKPCEWVDHDYEDPECFKISSAEIAFVNKMIKREKEYKNYYVQLFKHSIKDYFEQIHDIEWPEGFLNKKRLGLMSSIEVVNKFQL